MEATDNWEIFAFATKYVYKSTNITKSRLAQVFEAQEFATGKKGYFGNPLNYEIRNEEILRIL